jgi:hypothetical protein
MAYSKNAKDDLEAVTRYIKKIKKLIMGEPDVYCNGRVYNQDDSRWVDQDEK